MIGYLGYDAPDDFLQAGFKSYAVDGAPVFADFLDALPEKAETHVLAHSYGSLLTSKSLAEGARPDHAHVFGSPGIGVNSPDELNLEGKTIVTVTSNPGDRVVTIGPFGSMPPEHAISYPAMGNPPPEDSPAAKDHEPHVDCFDPRILADIITGEREPMTAEE